MERREHEKKRQQQQQVFEFSPFSRRSGGMVRIRQSVGRLIKLSAVDVRACSIDVYIVYSSICMYRIVYVYGRHIADDDRRRTGADEREQFGDVCVLCVSEFVSAGVGRCLL